MSHENDLCVTLLCVCIISDRESNGGLYIYAKVKKEKGPNSKAKAQLRKHPILSHLSRKQTRVILFLRLRFFTILPSTFSAFYDLYLFMFTFSLDFFVL